MADAEQDERYEMRDRQPPPDNDSRGYEETNLDDDEEVENNALNEDEQQEQAQIELDPDVTIGGTLVFDQDLGDEETEEQESRRGGNRRNRERWEELRELFSEIPMVNEFVKVIIRSCLKTSHKNVTKKVWCKRSNTEIPKYFVGMEGNGSHIRDEPMRKRTSSENSKQSFKEQS